MADLPEFNIDLDAIAAQHAKDADKIPTHAEWREAESERAKDIIDRFGKTVVESIEDMKQVNDAYQLGIIKTPLEMRQVREKQREVRRRMRGVTDNGHGGYEDSNGNQCDEDGYPIY